MSPSDLPDIVIRDAVPADVPAIAAIHVEGHREAHEGLIDEAELAVRNIELRTRVWGERMAAPPQRSFVVVAETGGTVIGFLSGRAARPDEDDGEGLGRWEDIYVSSRHKPRGRIVALLTEAAYERWRAFGYPDVVGFVAEGNERAWNLLTGPIGMRFDGHVAELAGGRFRRIRAGLHGWPED